MLQVAGLTVAVSVDALRHCEVHQAVLIAVCVVLWALLKETFDMEVPPVSAFCCATGLQRH